MKTARPVPIESFGDRYYMAPPLEYSLFNGAMFNGGDVPGPSLGGEAAGAAQAPGSSSGFLTSSELSDAPRRPQREREDSLDGTGGGATELLGAARDSIEARKAAYRLPQSSTISKGSTAPISSPASSRASSVCSTPRHSPEDGPGLGSLRQAQQPGGLVRSFAALEFSPPERRTNFSSDGGAAAGAGTSDPVEPISAFFSGLSLGKLLSPFTGGGHGDGDGAAAAAATVRAPAPQPHPVQQRVHLRPPEAQGYAAPVPESALPHQHLYGGAGGGGHYGGIGGSSVGSSRTPSPPVASSVAVVAPPGFASSSGSSSGLPQAGTAAVGPGPPQLAQRQGYGTAAMRGQAAATPLPSRTPSPHPAAAAAASGAPRPVSGEREQALAQEADVLAAWVEDMIVKSGGMAVVNRLDAALSLSNSRAYQVLCVRYTGLREFLSRNPSRFVFGVAEPSRELVVVLSTAVGGVGGEGISYTLPPRQPAAAGAAAGDRSHGGSASSADGDHPSRQRGVSAAPAAAAAPQTALSSSSRSSGGGNHRPWSESASERSASAAVSMGGSRRDHITQLNDKSGTSGYGGSSSSSLGMSAAGGSSGVPSALASSNWLEEKVAMESAEILKDAATRSLKAVELANTLRARLGTEVLALVREQHGGLLSLLERHPNLFRVDRIPKSDCVTLVCSMPLFSGGGNSGGSGSGMATPLESPRERLRGVGGSSGGGSSGYRSGPEDGPLSLPLSEGAGLGHGQVATQGATRCLHIGNVPMVMSEDELQRCFERYGRVEGLRVVSQRGHRFAFVNYVSIEEAVHAKACLSRQNVWRSAVSFARRESFRPLRCESFESVGSGGYASDHSVGSSDGRAALAAAAATGQGQGQGGAYGALPAGRPAAASSSSAYWPAAGTAPQQASQQQQQQGQPAAAAYAQRPHQQQQQQQLLPSFMPQQQPPPQQLSLFGSTLTSQQPGEQPHNDLLQQQQQQLMAGASSSAAASALAAVGSYGMGSLGGSSGAMAEFRAECPVMTTLTSDQFVPTQAWPANFAQDWPYVEAVVEQLRQVGGSTTVSKLRGLLKNRLGSARTVKSVPLKALLQAYGPLFVLHGNRVSLMSAAAGIGGGAGMQQLSMNGHGPPPPPGMRLGMGMGS